MAFRVLDRFNPFRPDTNPAGFGVEGALSRGPLVTPFIRLHLRPGALSFVNLRRSEVAFRRPITFAGRAFLLLLGRVHACTAPQLVRVCKPIRRSKHACTGLCVIPCLHRCTGRSPEKKGLLTPGGVLRLPLKLRRPVTRCACTDNAQKPQSRARVHKPFPVLQLDSQSSLNPTYHRILMRPFLYD